MIALARRSKSTLSRDSPLSRTQYLIVLLLSPSLRRRFEQNQEDCTFTVLALLPTATENILEALSVESITQELQYKRAERLGRSSGTSEVASDLSSGTPSVADDDGKSLSSFRTESYVHASQMADSQGESGEGQKEPQRPRKSKVQLWNDLKINCMWRM